MGAFLGFYISIRTGEDMGLFPWTCLLKSWCYNVSTITKYKFNFYENKKLLSGFKVTWGKSFQLKRIASPVNINVSQIFNEYKYQISISRYFFSHANWFFRQLLVILLLHSCFNSHIICNYKLFLLIIQQLLSYTNTCMQLKQPQKASSMLQNI